MQDKLRKAPCLGHKCRIGRINREIRSGKWRVQQQKSEVHKFVVHKLVYQSKKPVIETDKEAPAHADAPSKDNLVFLSI